jgi:dienelactone hydrolase
MLRGLAPSVALLAWLIGQTPARAGESVVTIASVRGETIPATLIQPDGPGPFPAVVIMHDCSGLGPRSSGAPRRWVAELVPQGYVVLLPDSFGPRDLPNGVCTETPERLRLATAYIRSGDAHGALAFLKTLSFVDPRRIGIMGGSHGGSSTLASMVEAGAGRHDGFAAGIALYPSCSVTLGEWSTRRPPGRSLGPAMSHSGVYRPVAPTLILAGEKDDWTPAEPCRWLAETARAAGQPVSIKIYPGAHHAFDSPAPVRYVEARTNGNSPTGKGATTGGDPAAWADAKLQVAAFFAQYLRR